MTLAGIDQQTQLRFIEIKKSIVDLRCKLCSAEAVIWVAVVVLSAAIVQEGKGLDHPQVRARASGKPEAVVPNPSPMWCTVNATPVKGEVHFEKS
ncbi:MAG: hypothetical protein IPN27_08640 [Cellvibrionales bacterium]|nr:hypothetical protein [Cellvibrionales bacterium]MBK8676435.1 hypothetical protein [Cellvibrionales bacterium]